MSTYQNFLPRFFTPILVSATLLFSMSSAVANDQVGEVEVLIDQLVIYPEVSYGQLELIVAGDSSHWKKSFAPGEAVEFSLLDYPLTDGQYRYELVASPPAEEWAIEIARNDRELMQDLDRLERNATFRQRGRFEVRRGEILLVRKTHEDPTQELTSKMRQEVYQ